MQKRVFSRPRCSRVGIRPGCLVRFGIGALRLLLALRLREGVNSFDSSWFARIDGRALTLKLSESGVFTAVAAAPPRGDLN